MPLSLATSAQVRQAASITTESHLGLALLCLVLLSACATSHQPQLRLEFATRALVTAEENGTEHELPESLQDARSRLQAARVAMSQRRYALAARLAAEAEAEALLADAQANALHWRQVVDFKTQRNETLRRSLDEAGRE